MIELTIPAGEWYNESVTPPRFEYCPETTLKLEHSLISVSKWESKWKKPFIAKDKTSEKSLEEMVDYVRCMTLNIDEIDPKAFRSLTPYAMAIITQYIDDPMTATTITDWDDNRHYGRVVMTSEVIYQLMTVLNIPFECQTWHLNRLLTLIRVCSIRAQGPKSKKMSRGETINRNRSLNEQRKAQYKTKG